MIPANPAADLDLPRKQARYLTKCLSGDEIKRLLALPNTANAFGLRDISCDPVFSEALQKGSTTAAGEVLFPDWPIGGVTGSRSKSGCLGWAWRQRKRTDFFGIPVGQ